VIRVVDDPAAEAAELIAAAVRAGGHIALAGGSTPKAAYGIVAGMELDWSGATVWFGDERCVPADDELSNYGMAREALLDRVEGATVKRMAGEKGPHAGAEDYERELRETLGEALPRLDLILLGLGPDRHTASLFPG
jgi:6-phosphogluconolactonase